MTSSSAFPLLLHRLLLFLHVFEVLLLLSMAGVLWLLSSGAAFDVVNAIFPFGGGSAPLFYHDSVLGFYAAFLALLLIVSVIVGIGFAQWKNGGSHDFF